MKAMRPLIIIAILSQVALHAIAGTRDTATFTSLNLQRIHTTKTGMTILGLWGTANVITGIVGTISAKEEEWKRFHQMNAIWGGINLGIAAAGYLGAKREEQHSYSPIDALRHHEGIKRLFLINAGLDVLYIGTGTYLLEHSKVTTSDKDQFKGYGKSLILQGAGLLIFDISMFTAHQHSNKAWYKALQGLCVTGNGLSWRYSFR
jgi:hypothetical protein